MYNMPKLSNLVQFKTGNEPEGHLNEIRIDKLVNHFASFCLSTESGR
jgi:hypothetical protein